MGMIRVPRTPTTPSAVAIADGSGDSTKDHSARNKQSKVLTVTKTRWNPLIDMAEKGWGLLAGGVEKCIEDRIPHGEGSQKGEAADHAETGTEEPIDRLLLMVKVHEDKCNQ